ncbi:MAG: hypothetical protein RL661_1081 [Pseudomonadota bacterium]|jgi:hypothetical protein
MAEIGKIPRSVQISSFLDKVARAPAMAASPSTGKLIFALDATASREPAWEQAHQLQSTMFDVASSLGGLSMQLCFFQGMANFFASPWLNDAKGLKAKMERVHCLGGLTQIGRVLEHALQEARRERIHAVIYIGDCVEENPDALSHLAGKLGVLNTPLFVFQEGHDPNAEMTFRQLAKLSGGAYGRFDAGSARQLADLLGAVAAFASGGYAAMLQFGRDRGGLAQQLTHQLPPR